MDVFIKDRTSAGYDLAQVLLNVVRAAYAGNAQTRKITVGDRLRTEYLRWPSNPETDFPGPKSSE